MERISELTTILSNYFTWNKWRLDSFARIISSMLRNDVEPAQIAALTGLSLAAVYGIIKEQIVTG